MASKASMLKNGANKASSGLFAGMTRLSEEQDNKKQEAKKTEEKKSAAETKKVTKPVEEKVEEEVVVEPVILQEVEPEVEEKVAISDPEPQQPVYSEPVAPQAYQAPVQDQMQAQVPLQNPVNQIPVAQYQQPSAQAPVYNQPVASYQQPVMMQPSPVQAYTEPKRTEPQTRQEKSRYEKEKFLLLDIRGYRDYVEHMAKASNMSATKYIRSLIDQDMKRNMDIYMAHKQLEETLKGRR